MTIHIYYSLETCAVCWQQTGQRAKKVVSLCHLRRSLQIIHTISFWILHGKTLQFVSVEESEVLFFLFGMAHGSYLNSISI